MLTRTRTLLVTVITVLALTGCASTAQGDQPFSLRKHGGCTLLDHYC